MRRSSSWLIGIAFTSLTLAATGCSVGSNSGSGTANPPTVKSATVTLSNATLNIGDKGQASCSVLMSDGTTNSNCGSFASSASSIVSIDASTGKYTANAAGTANITATATGTSVVSPAVAVTVSQPTASVTGVSVNPTSASITDVQPLKFTFTVSATGGVATTANVSVNPTSAGTLSATSNVPSGTQVTFTPAGTGAGSATITVTATADASMAATLDVTVTQRAINISLAHYVDFLPDCAGILNESVTQTGVMAGDTLHMFPYPASSFTQAPGATFTASLGINNSYSDPNKDGTTRVCSPGAYDFNVTGIDGATSNHQYLLIAPPYNQWAGYDATDEYFADLGNNQICKSKLADGSSDGCIQLKTSANGLTIGMGLKTVVDGAYILNMGTVVSIYDSSTGVDVGGNGEAGDAPVDFAVANKIVGYVGSNSQGSNSPKVEKASFFREGPATSTDVTVTDYTIPNGIPAAIGMTTACISGSNTATAAVWDSQAVALRRLDVTAPTKGAMTVDDSNGLVQLPFANSVEVADTTMPRHLVVFPKSCTAAIMGPVADSNSSTGYDVALVVVDLASMKILGMTTVASQPIPATAMELVLDPAGSAVVIDSADTTAGNSPVERISWAVDSLNTLTFNAAQQYTGGSPVGVYGVALGVLQDGTVSIGQRGKGTRLAPSTLAPLPPSK